jgi:importin-9
VLTFPSSFAQALDNAVLTGHAARIAKNLGPFMLNTSEDTLLLVLETISVGIDIDEGKWLTPDLAHSLAVAILEVWGKTNKGILSPLVSVTDSFTQH